MHGAIMQPTYFPWLGYFAMIDSVDVFVFLDSVQLVKRSWQVRNRIKQNDRELMLAIPVHTDCRDTRICDALIVETQWKDKHLKTIAQSYAKTPYYDEIMPLINKVFSIKNNNLASFNESIIVEISDYLGIETKFYKSSELKELEGTKDQLLVNICKALEINTYLSARGSADYIERDNEAGAFADSGIVLEYQNYNHPTYNQVGKEFLPYMCIVDALFNCGKQTIEIIRSGNKEPLTSKEISLLKSI